MKYGTFIGDAHPGLGAPDASPAQLLAFALDRFTEDGAETTLTAEQVHGVLLFAFDALQAAGVPA